MGAVEKSAFPARFGSVALELPRAGLFRFDRPFARVNVFLTLISASHACFNHMPPIDCELEKY